MCNLCRELSFSGNNENFMITFPGGSVMGTESSVFVPREQQNDCQPLNLVPGLFLLVFIFISFDVKTGENFDIVVNYEERNGMADMITIRLPSLSIEPLFEVDNTITVMPAPSGPFQDIVSFTFLHTIILTAHF